MYVCVCVCVNIYIYIYIYIITIKIVFIHILLSCSELAHFVVIEEHLSKPLKTPHIPAWAQAWIHFILCLILAAKKRAQRRVMAEDTSRMSF
jgi:hypothetical protein